MSSACRVFLGRDGEGGPFSFVFASALFPSIRDANRFYIEKLKELRDGNSTTEVEQGYQFGERQGTFKESTYLESDIVVFADDRHVSTWTVTIEDGNGFEWLQEIKSNLRSSGCQDGLEDSVLKWLPSLDHLPKGFTLFSESFSDEADDADRASGQCSSDQPTSEGPDLDENPEEIAFAVNGSGTNSTEVFKVDGDWDLEWKFDCASVGIEGTFMIDIYDAAGQMSFDLLPVLQHGESGSGVEHYHRGGDLYLNVISICDWEVTVYD